MEQQQNFDAEKFAQGGESPFFKAKDFAGNSTKVIAKNFREANLQFSGLSLIMDFDYKKTERSFPLNKTNVKATIKAYGVDYRQWIGKTFILVRYKVKNPKSGELVDSIALEFPKK